VGWIYLRVCLRRIPQDLAVKIVKLRAGGAPVSSIAEELNISRSTVYNYLAKVQAFEDEGFVEMLAAELEAFHGIYLRAEQLIPVSDQAKKLAGLLRKYVFMPGEFIAQAVLNAHWRRLKACRKQST
jgi:AcrR family transcriptional regulator